MNVMTNINSILVFFNLAFTSPSSVVFSFETTTRLVPPLTLPLRQPIPTIVNLNKDSRMNILQKTNTNARMTMSSLSSSLSSIKLSNTYSSVSGGFCRPIQNYSLGSGTNTRGTTSKRSHGTIVQSFPTGRTAYFGGGSTRRRYQFPRAGNSWMVSTNRNNNNGVSSCLYATTTATPDDDRTQQPQQQQQQQVNTNNEGDSSPTNEEELDFTWDSFDNQGKWQIIDWTKVPIPHQHTNNTNTTAYQIAKTEQLCTKIPSPTNPSPVELTIIRDRICYIKRDDLLRLPQSGVSGNKARKMLTLNELGVGEFPEVLVSYGGSQSNAMLALAAIAHAKNEEAVGVLGVGVDASVVDGGDDTINDGGNLGLAQEDETNSMSVDAPTSTTTPTTTSFFQQQGKRKRIKRFVYYTKKLPRYLRKQPSGNLLRALSLGMEIVELSHDKYKELFGGDDGGSSTPPPSLEPPVAGKSVWIPQGGACGLAVKGVQLLAHEIVSFWAIQGRGAALSVCVPGGTCTTAMLLSREINAILKARYDDGDDNTLDIQVVVIPCVGGDAYALRQMSSLDISTGGNGKDDLPAILIPLNHLEYGPARRRNNGYFTFGEPASAILDVFEEMNDEHGVYLDLLYGAPAWSLLLQHWYRPSTTAGVERQSTPIDGRQIMYVHSGGLEGISSQLTRYKHKGLLDNSQIGVQ